MERKKWIDQLKGISILAILFDHTEIYFTGDNIVPYNFYVVDALVLFFFLSGYVFFDPTTFSLKKKVASIARGLIYPYFAFTTLMALPKALAHGSSIPDTFTDIILGNASWFIAALIVAEFIFALVLWLSRGKAAVLVATMILSFYLCNALSNNILSNFWQLDNAFMALSLLCLGTLYRKYETFMAKLTTWGVLSVLYMLFVIVKLYVSRYETSLLVEPILISNWLVFFFNCTISILLFVGLAKRLPTSSFLEWVGVRSLVFYFLCGGIPLLVSKAMNKFSMSYHGDYYMVLIAFVCVVVIASFASHIIYKYAPFLIKAPRLKKHN